VYKKYKHKHGNKSISEIQGHSYKLFLYLTNKLKFIKNTTCKKSHSTANYYIEKIMFNVVSYYIILYYFLKYYIV